MLTSQILKQRGEDGISLHSAAYMTPSESWDRYANKSIGIAVISEADLESLDANEEDMASNSTKEEDLEFSCARIELDHIGLEGHASLYFKADTSNKTKKEHALSLRNATLIRGLIMFTDDTRYIYFPDEQIRVPLDTSKEYIEAVSSAWQNYADKLRPQALPLKDEDSRQPSIKSQTGATIAILESGELEEASAYAIAEAHLATVVADGRPLNSDGWTFVRQEQ